MLKTGIIILAAGASSRMGQPKQLLKVGEKTLIKQLVECTFETECYPIVVVLGANKKHIAPELEKMPITIIDNQNWTSGMASSIKMGLAGAYMTFKDLDAIVFLTCDQPYIDASVINKLLEKANQFPDSLAVACEYGGVVGVPALIKRPLFNDLLELKREEGAKKILLQHRENIQTIPFEPASVDLDTPEDWVHFCNTPR